jgi:hypothetical protein
MSGTIWEICWPENTQKIKPYDNIKYGCGGNRSLKPVWPDSETILVVP